MSQKGRKYLKHDRDTEELSDEATERRRIARAQRERDLEALLETQRRRIKKIDLRHGHIFPRPPLPELHKGQRWDFHRPGYRQLYILPDRLPDSCIRQNFNSVRIKSGAGVRQYTPNLIQYRVYGNEHQNYLGEIYITYRPWIIPHGHRLHRWPGVRPGATEPEGVYEGPRNHPDFIYTDLIQYILITARYNYTFHLNHVELQFLRSFSLTYSERITRPQHDLTSDFFVYVEYFEQYLPGVVIEILIKNCHLWTTFVFNPVTLETTPPEIVTTLYNLFRLGAGRVYTERFKITELTNYRRQSGWRRESGHRSWGLPRNNRAGNR